MPNPSDHKDKADKNQEFSQTIAEEHSEYNDWIITAKFYSALHYVDKVLVEEGYKTENHGERFEKIEQARNIPPRVRSLYSTLYDLSEQARYKCIELQQGQVNSADKALTEIKKELDV